MQIKRFFATVLIIVMVLTMTPFMQMHTYAAKKVKLNKTKITIQVGKSKKLKVKNKPKGVKVKWVSKNKAVAKVTKKGVVKAKKAGKATIIAKVGSKKLKCRVTVKKAHTEPVATTQTPQTTKQEVVVTTESQVVTTKAVETTKSVVATTKSEVTTQSQQTTQSQPITQAQPTTKSELTTQAQPTTQLQQPTQVQPTTQSQEQPTQAQNITLSDVQGLTYAGNTDYPYYFAWAPITEAAGYHIYVNNKHITDVAMQNVNLSADVFPSNGTYVIGVQAYNDSGVSKIATVEYLVAGLPDNPTEPESGATSSSQTTSGQEVTTTSSSRTWTQVEASNGNLFYADADNISVVNKQQPGWASNAGIYAHTSMGISHVNINGVMATDSQVAIQGAGAIVYENVIPTSEIKVEYCSGDGTVIGTIYYKSKSGASEVTTASQPVTQVQPTTQSQQTTASQPTTQSQQPTQNQEVTTKSNTFTTDSSLDKAFGLDVKNPDSGIISVVWGAGNPNCYNLYIDGVRKRTKVPAAEYKIPVQTEGNHTVSVTHVNPTANTESDPISAVINVSGTAAEETTAIAESDMPQIDESIQKQDGKVVLQLNNKTNGQYSDSQIYWLIVGRNPSTNALSYVDSNGNLIQASASDNDGTIGSRSYSRKIVHTLADSKVAQIPAITSGRMYISYGEPVYITFTGDGYAGPDINNTGDANYNTMFEYLEFTTESVNGGILFHGNTTRVDFFSFPMITRLTDEYGGYDTCVGDVGTREEIFASYKNTVSDSFDTLVTTPRIMCPAKLTFGEGKTYGNYYDDYINRFWSKYASEDLVINSEAGNFTGRVSGNRLIFTNSAGTYYVDKPSTQDVLEGRGAFDKVSDENKNSENGRRCELAIEAQLCAAFNRGIAMEPSKWTQPSTYYRSGEIYNEYAAFFHEHAVSGRAYGFCYDDVCDQSTLVVCNNAARWTIDLKW